MTARLLVVGLDSATPSLLAKWAGDGTLSTMRDLERTSITASLENAIDTFPGAVWFEILSGQSTRRTGIYYRRDQIHTGEGTRRSVDPSRFVPHDFYDVAARAGRQVAVINPSQRPLSSGFRGFGIQEWGAHDPEAPTVLRSTLPGVTVLPPLPVTDCDNHHGRTDAGYRDLIEGLRQNVAIKADLVLDVLKRAEWDLFFVTFSEAHCAGHQLWHFWDETHPAHPHDAPEDLRNGMKSVFAAVDSAVGDLRDAAGNEAIISVVASHGMGKSILGPQLLPEVIARLGLGVNRPVVSLGDSLRKRLSPGRFVAAVRRRIWAGPGHGPQHVSPRQFIVPGNRALAVPNNRIGAIRFNIRGREPFGSIDRNDVEDLVDEVRRGLTALVEPGTDEPIIDRVVETRELFHEHHADLPDLLVAFRQDLGPLDACWSERTGLVERPALRDDFVRTGDHVSEARVWFGRNDREFDVDLGEVSSLDLAPTWLEALGVADTEERDGRVLKEVLSQLRPGSTAAPVD